MSIIKIDTIREQVAASNWRLLTDVYKSLDTQMEFECPNGHHLFLTWKRARNKLECPLCKQTGQLNNDKVVPKSKGAQRLLALDQASHTTGYAIFDNSKLVKCGHFITSLSSEIERLSAVKTWLISMIEEWRPDFIGLEGIQLQDESSGQKMGVDVFQTLARLQGILMEVCYERNIPFEICPTGTWRHACGVKGRTRSDRKKSMQIIVLNKYGLKVSDDESDAIGIGQYLSTKINKSTTITNWEI